MCKDADASGALFDYASVESRCSGVLIKTIIHAGNDRVSLYEVYDVVKGALLYGKVVFGIRKSNTPALIIIHNKLGRAFLQELISLISIYLTLQRIDYSPLQNRS